MIKVRMLMFGPLAEQAIPEIPGLTLSPGASVSDAVDAASRLYPVLAGALSRAACAVNERYASADAQLKDGDVVALIPPVSGG